MAKKRPRVNLSQSIQPQKGDLEKLFSSAGDVEQASGLQLLAVRLDAIRPDPSQPRRTFPVESLRDLSDSIRQDGVIQPIEVTEVAPNRYMIVHGERRWRAAALAGLETMPAVVRRRDYDHLTRFVRQLVENIQREDLNDVDRAAGLLHLRELMAQELETATAVAAEENEQGSDRPWDSKVTWAKVGKRLGYSRQRIHQLIQLLKLPDEIKEAVREGSLSERDTRVYQGLNQLQQRYLHRVRMAGELTAAELRRVVQHLKEDPSRQVVEIIEIVRHRAEPKDEHGFTSSFERPGEAEGEAGRPAIAPPDVSLAPDPEWSEKKSGRGRKNSLNINRVHWARDHLSRIQLQGLSGNERCDLLNVLLRLQQDIATFVESLQDTEPRQS
jgi:ParB family transcriptional regulator, chromosome partitioning protein